MGLNPIKFGSLEESIMFLALRLRDKGIRTITVFCEQPPEHLKDKFIDAGCITERLDLGNCGFQKYFSLFRIIQKYKPNVVHIRFWSIFSILPIIIYFLGVKNIIYTDEHSNDDTNPFKNKVTFLRNKFCFKFVKRVVAVSKFVERRCAKIPGTNPQKVVLIYNGVNLNRFAPSTTTNGMKKRFEIPSNNKVITTIAHLIPEKGVDYFLEAAKILLASEKALIFLVVGEGSHIKKLLDLTNRLEINEHVRFLGIRNDTDEILKVTDIFVCPSVWNEAFGLVIAEAMGCGKPVVASSVGGIPELIEDSITGILIPPARPKDLAEAILTLLQNNELALGMGQAGRKRTEEYFDLRMWVDKTIALYEECLATQTEEVH